MVTGLAVVDAIDAIGLDPLIDPVFVFGAEAQSDEKGTAIGGERIDAEHFELLCLKHLQTTAACRWVDEAVAVGVEAARVGKFPFDVGKTAKLCTGQSSASAPSVVRKMIFMRGIPG